MVAQRGGHLAAARAANRQRRAAGMPRDLKPAVGGRAGRARMRGVAWRKSLASGWAKGLDSVVGEVFGTHEAVGGHRQGGRKLLLGSQDQSVLVCGIFGGFALG